MTNYWMREQEIIAKTDLIKEHVEFLANTQMNMSLETWNIISNNILATANTILELLEENNQLRYAMKNILSTAQKALFE